MRAMKGRVLIIAGSDSGGGAGIQADIKTVSAYGAYAATAITAVTVQNTLGIEKIHFIPTDIVCDQIRVVMCDIGADVIKTGMMGSAEVISQVAETLDRFAEDVPVVVDPVMVAKGGARLLDSHAIDALKAGLISRAALVTPNLPEAENLTGMTIGNVDDMQSAAERLLDLGAQGVLLTGGHLAGQMVFDVLKTREITRVFSSPRLDTRHTHGTGCTLASALAAGLAQQLSLVDTVERAIGFVQQAIRTAPGWGAGHGPINHLHDGKD